MKGPSALGWVQMRLAAASLHQYEEGKVALPRRHQQPVFPGKPPKNQPTLSNAARSSRGVPLLLVPALKGIGDVGVQLLRGHARRAPLPADQPADVTGG